MARSPWINNDAERIKSSAGNGIKDIYFPHNSDFLCTLCAKGKQITKPSYLKLKAEPLGFLKRIQGDICGPIHPLPGPYIYFMVLIDASTRWNHVCLFARNHVFPKFIA
jgi:hypothetical protein